MMVWGDLFAKGANADLDRARDYRADLDRPELALGSPLSLLIWGSLQGIWPATRHPTASLVASPRWRPCW